MGRGGMVWRAVVALLLPALSQGTTGGPPTVCSGPCRCPTAVPQCGPGVEAVTDGCGCCAICPSQLGEPCDVLQRCDHSRGLECVYPAPTGPSGVCRVRQARSCRLGSFTYQDGAIFAVDCRTQCTCQNGTYGCVSLCPQERVRPSAPCHNPRLVRLSRAACCLEWLCDPPPPTPARVPCTITEDFPWSPCSVTCGLGVSTRKRTTHDCRKIEEKRLCQLRPCWEPETTAHRKRRRRTHECRATLRAPEPQRLTDGQGCTSVRTYMPKSCGNCPGRCCRPASSTTRPIALRCADGKRSVLDFLWILQCSCTPC